VLKLTILFPRNTSPSRRKQILENCLTYINLNLIGEENFVS